MDVVQPEPLIEKSGGIAAAAGSLWSTAGGSLRLGGVPRRARRAVLSRASRRADVVGAGDGGQRPLGLRLRASGCCSSAAATRVSVGHDGGMPGFLSNVLGVAPGEDRRGRARELERELRSAVDRGEARADGDRAVPARRRSRGSRARPRRRSSPASSGAGGPRARSSSSASTTAGSRRAGRGRPRWADWSRVRAARGRPVPHGAGTRARRAAAHRPRRRRHADADVLGDVPGDAHARGRSGATSYSYCSASSGLSRAARRAGKIAARIPTTIASAAKMTSCRVGR